MDLIRASRDGDIERVRLLLDGGADINAAYADGWTPLHSAVCNGRLEVVRLLIDRGADINLADSYGITALMQAARRGHLEVVRLLLDKGADINVADSTGRTALINAVLGRHHEIVRLLLDGHADINAADSNGITALHYTADYEIARLLIDGGADINAVASNGIALHYAASNGHLEIVGLLIDSGADINVADSSGMTALINAAYRGRLDVVRFLLDRGADINVADSTGRTALHYAIFSREKYEIVRLLLDRGANINVADSSGMTALHYAAGGGHLEIVRLLIERGADTEAIDSDGNTALAMASAGVQDDSDSEDETDYNEILNGIVELLTNPNRKKKPRITSDWMEICDSLGTAKLAELRAIVDQHVVRSNFDRVKTFFEFTGTFSGFKAYIGTLSKRKICAYLARYYEALKPKYQHDCSVNESNFAGDDFSDLPPERVIKLTQGGVTYCFDVLEVASFNRKNPYTNAELPESFLAQAVEQARSIPKDIHELKQRGRYTGSSLRNEVVALQDRADTAVPYFPRRKFGLLTTKQLEQLANRLAEYDPSFGLTAVKREVAAAEIKNKPLVWKRAILKRLIAHPETLGNVLNEWII